MLNRFKRYVCIVVVNMVLAACASNTYAQEPLPNFKVENKGNNRIVVSWTNPFDNLIQLSVQRSFDGKKFSTMYSAPSPELPSNGYSETIKPGTTVQYRIFYVMAGGSYYFTKAEYPSYTPDETKTITDTRRDQVDEVFIKMLKKAANPNAPDSLAVLLDHDYSILQADTLIAKVNGYGLLKFRDSILINTKDTLYQINDDSLVLSLYSPPFAQSTSKYVYLNQDGYMVIDLPLAATKKYKLVIMEETDKPILVIEQVKTKFFMLDKSNFYHGGWYKFEITENGRVFERNRIFLTRDF